MKKRGILVACLALGTTVTVSAFTHKVVSANMKTQAISYKGSILNQEILTYNNTTYVPLRNFSELVGMPIDYKNGTIYLNDTPSNSNNNSVINNEDSDYIGESKAKSIALQHAGVQEKDVVMKKLILDSDNHRVEYEVEFYAGNKEYDYEIDALTGHIISYDQDIEGFQIPNTNNNANQTSSSQNINIDSSTYIGTEKAEQIALNHAKLTKQQVGYIQNKLDKDDGRWEYEIEFRYGTTEYEYNINAYTGEIVDYSIDND